MERERLSKECTFTILKHYYPIKKGVYSMMRKHGILLRTEATIRADRDNFYITGTNRSIVSTIFEVLS